MVCPICFSDHVSRVVDLGGLPLSVLSLPDTVQESVQLDRHRIRIMRCSNCSHVYNTSYDPAFKQVFNGCTMYNRGHGWSEHMDDVAQHVLEYAAGGRVLEIGSGNGEFAKACEYANYIAYEPTDDALKCSRYVETRQRLFLPDTDVAIDKPDVIVMRHVLEHFQDPGEFLSDLSYYLRYYCMRTFLVVEVPNIQNALANGRIEDWVYEHPNHFTPGSLETLTRQTGWSLTDLATCYNREVILATLSPRASVLDVQYGLTFDTVLSNLQSSRDAILELDEVVLWGGAGKGATIINLLDLPPGSVHVVDSDPRKHGKYVPGTGLLIQSPDLIDCLNTPTVIVTTSWRTVDIVDEILRDEHSVGHVYSFNKGLLNLYQG